MTIQEIYQLQRNLYDTLHGCVFGFGEGRLDEIGKIAIRDMKRKYNINENNISITYEILSKTLVEPDNKNLCHLPTVRFDLYYQIGDIKNKNEDIYFYVIRDLARSWSYNEF